MHDFLKLPFNIRAAPLALLSWSYNCTIPVKDLSPPSQNNGDRSPMTSKDKKTGIPHLTELVKEIKFAMLTTTDTDGSLRSRPMATQTAEFDGQTLWFFTEANSPKSQEIANHHEVNVSY